MKKSQDRLHIVRILPLILLVLMQMASVAQERAIEDIPIPADSDSPYDFRGESTWEDPAYQALFKAKTYGELYEALRRFLGVWAERQNDLKEPAHVEAYFTGKQALLRTYYLMGRVHEGDRLLSEFHPKVLGLIPEDKERKPVDAGEREKILRMAGRIQALYAELGEDDPFAEGLPQDVHQLYAPVFKLLKDLSE